MAEPGALVGFLGPKVFEALNGEPFPAGVQQAENLAAKGVIDAVVSSEQLPELVDRSLRVLLDPAEAPSLARRVTGASIDRDERAGKGASDHAPVIADLA